MEPRLDDIAQPERTRAILKKYGFKFKKSLGQNFLTNPAILTDIVTAADVTAEDDIIEIGPGIGALTEQLARQAHYVLAVEIDERLLPVLKDTLSPYDNIRVMNADILTVDLDEVFKERLDGNHRIKIVANLPYYITTPILLHLLGAKLPIDRMVMMMQKEVADRLTAAPGSKAYGSLSVAVQVRAEVEVAFMVSRDNFMPAPNVDSAIVTFHTRETPLVTPRVEAAFERLVRGSFAQRRKNLMNNLTNLYGKMPATKEILQGALDTLGVASTIRGEQLSIEQFSTLSDLLVAAGLD